MISLKFAGIDSWNRPVFKGNDKKFYGSTDVLCSYHEDIFADTDKLRKIFDSLCYFGSRFDCEPWGTPISDEYEIERGE